MKMPFLTFILLILITTVVHSQPGDITEILRESATLIQSGKFRDAEPLLKKAIMVSPRNADAHNLLGIVFDQLGNAAAAETAYKTAIRLNPTLVSPRANLGILLAKNKRETEAIRNFEAVLKLNPNHANTIANLGLLYVSTNKFQRAVGLLQRADELQPSSADIKLNLGIALMRTGLFDRAESALLSAMTLAPANSEPFYYLGLISLEKSKTEVAGAYFSKVLEMNPDHVAANFMLGELFAKAGRYAEAKSFYDKAVALEPEKAVHHIRLGGMQIYLTDFISAIRTFKNAASKFPKIPEIFYFLAIAARGVGDYDEANAATRKALALNADYADALALSGALSFDRGDFIASERQLRRSITINKGLFNANYDLGKLLFKTKRTAEALTFFQTAAKIKPDSADVHYQLFLVYSRLKLTAEAERELQIYKKLTEKPSENTKQQM